MKSRRSIITVGLALAASPAAGLMDHGGPQVDPIFAAIARHREAVEAFEAAPHVTYSNLLECSV